jgi:hypothetical protein
VSDHEFVTDRDMLPFRTTLLVLTMGSAAVIGWLCYPTQPIDDFSSRERGVNQPTIHPSCAFPHGRHSIPRRQGTNPDPTPDDWGDECSSLVDLHDDGSDLIIHETATHFAAFCVIKLRSPSWSEPAPSTLLLQVTHRFRC